MSGSIDPTLPIADDDLPSFLNVGGANKSIQVPAQFAGWQHLLLDIAPGPDVDLVLDARLLTTASPGQFDAVYCSHNLEHYYRHDCDKVLTGFLHVLKLEGYAQIIVPNTGEVFRQVLERGLDIDDVLYQSPAGPITPHDVIYGLGSEIERSGLDFYAHKRGFTPRSMQSTLQKAGFKHIKLWLSDDRLEIRVFAFKSVPTPEQVAGLKL